MNIEHDPDGGEFRLLIDGHVARLGYRLHDDDDAAARGTLEIITTFVPTELRGRQLGKVLVDEAVAHAAARDLDVRPTCSFAARLLAGP